MKGPIQKGKRERENPKVTHASIDNNKQKQKPLFRHDVVKKLHSLWGRV